MSTESADGDAESLGYRATAEDPRTIERWLTALATHTHDDATRLASPTPADDPTVVLSGAPGSLPAGATFHYSYSLVDAYGLETTPSDEVTIELPGLMVPDPPDCFALSAGTLAEDTYFYAVTAVTAAGVESILSEDVPVTLSFGDGGVEVTFAALPVDAVSWNVWRKTALEDGYSKIATGVASATWVDSGAPSDPLAGTWDHLPPEPDTDDAAYAVTVTLPVGLSLAGVTGWRLYRTEFSGVYEEESLVHEVVETDVNGALLRTWTDTGDVLRTGSPTLVSQTFTPPGPIRWTDETTGIEWTLFVDNGSLSMRDGNGTVVPVGNGGTAGEVILPSPSATRTFKVVVTDEAGTLGTIQVTGPATPGTATTGTGSPTGQPTNFAATFDSATNSTTFTWDPYQSMVEWDFADLYLSIDTGQTFVLAASATTHTVAGLTTGTHEALLSPRTSTGVVGGTSSVQFGVNLNTVAPMGVVSGVSVVDNANGTLTATWSPYVESDPAEAFDGYEVRIWTPTGAIVGGGALSTDTSGTFAFDNTLGEHFVVVHAKSSTFGLGPADYGYSSVNSQARPYRDPGAVTGFAVNPNPTNTAVGVAWNEYVPAATEDFTRYEVYYEDEAFNGYTQFFAAPSTGGLITPTPPPGTYKFKVRAAGSTPFFDSVGPWSAEVTGVVIVA